MVLLALLIFAQPVTSTMSPPIGWMGDPLVVSQQNDEGSEEVIARVGQTNVTAPVFENKVKPEYPEKAKGSKLQGYVILEAVFREDGRVEDVKVLLGLGKNKFGFEKAAVAAVKQWTYQPGKVDGVPAAVRMTVKVDFVLEKTE